MPGYAISPADVHEAARRLRGRVHRTPVFTCGSLDGRAGLSLFLKAENLQRAGAFKARGAMNAVLALPEALAAAGVATHSSGNHAAALALAARERGIPAFVVMPADAPAVKRQAVEGYGAKVVTCGADMASREATAARVVAETGATLIHPFEHPDVMAGQGTLALELLEQVPDLDAIIAPISGGGLISGVAIAGQDARPGLRVFAAEPAGADDAARSKASGARQPVGVARTLADGLRASVGQNPWPILRDRVEDVIVVSDAEIVAAMRLLFERAKLVVEPSGATALAAALHPALRARGGLSRVGVVLSGGNVDLDALPWAAQAPERLPSPSDPPTGAATRSPWSSAG